MRWAFAAALCLGAMPASAAMKTDVGVLTCTLAEHGEKGTDPDSQTRAMLCSFKPKGTGPEESYTGEIKKVGSQTELSGKLVLIWAVMGPSDRKLKPAVLEQTYVGEAAGDLRLTSASRRSCSSAKPTRPTACSRLPTSTRAERQPERHRRAAAHQVDAELIGQPRRDHAPSASTAIALSSCGSLPAA